MNNMKMRSILIGLILGIVLLSGCIEEGPEKTTTTTTTTSTTTSTTTTSTTTTTTTTTTIPILSTSEDVRIAGYQFEAPYRPEKNFLREEWVVLKNTGNYTVNMTGWKIKNRNYRDSYTFPEFYLKPGGSVKIHTGEGLDTEGHLFMNRRTPFWDNDVDVITVFDSKGKKVEWRRGLGRLTYSID
ncbi:MAG: hypothetical protein DRO89_02470 [Candidatus Altiarchaeales archaeon]|nr:MAG: hypothetical protein DRO89_02470 [Candidatus Altiarchaeales archaeon]